MTFGFCPDFGLLSQALLNETLRRPCAATSTPARLSRRPTVPRVRNPVPEPGGGPVGGCGRLAVRPARIRRTAPPLRLAGKLRLAAKPQRTAVLTGYLLQKPPRAGSLSLRAHRSAFAIANPHSLERLGQMASIPPTTQPLVRVWYSAFQERIACIIPAPSRVDQEHRKGNFVLIIG